MFSITKHKHRHRQNERQRQKKRADDDEVKRQDLLKDIQSPDFFKKRAEAKEEFKKLLDDLRERDKAATKSARRQMKEAQQALEVEKERSSAHAAELNKQLEIATKSADEAITQVKQLQQQLAQQKTELDALRLMEQGVLAEQDEDNWVKSTAIYKQQLEEMKQLRAELAIQKSLTTTFAAHINAQAEIARAQSQPSSWTTQLNRAVAALTSARDAFRRAVEKLEAKSRISRNKTLRATMTDVKWQFEQRKPAIKRLPRSSRKFVIANYDSLLYGTHCRKEILEDRVKHFLEQTDRLLTYHDVDNKSVGDGTSGSCCGPIRSWFRGWRKW